MDACGSVAILEAALAKALPPGCCVANVYLWRGQARVRLGIDDVAAMAALRDEILLESGFEEKLTKALPRWRRPATDEELSDLGYEKLVTSSGREFYVHENEAQFERPTVPVLASRRPATDEELPGLGYERLVTTSDREFYVLAEVHPRRSRCGTQTARSGACRIASRRWPGIRSWCGAASSFFRA